MGQKPDFTEGAFIVSRTLVRAFLYLDGLKSVILKKIPPHLAAFITILASFLTSSRFKTLPTLKTPIKTTNGGGFTLSIMKKKIYVFDGILLVGKVLG